MKISQSKLKQIIREELGNLMEAEGEWVLERSGVSWNEKVVGGGSAADPSFGSLEKAKVFKSRGDAKAFKDGMDLHVSVEDKSEFNK